LRVEVRTEREQLPLAYEGRGPYELLARDQVERPELVVVAPATPVPNAFGGAMEVVQRGDGFPPWPAREDVMDLWIQDAR
jgi:hypothetical protein